jgi:hypothetical protein
MPYYFFVWTEQRIAHLADNDVTPEEFEEVVCNPAGTTVSHSSGRPIAYGKTSTGRTLMCVYEFADSDTVVPFTAFEPDEE